MAALKSKPRCLPGTGYGLPYGFCPEITSTDNGLNPVRLILPSYVEIIIPTHWAETTSCPVLFIGVQILPTTLGGGPTSSAQLYTPRTPRPSTPLAWNGARNTSSHMLILVFFRFFTSISTSLCGSVAISLHQTPTVLVSLTPGRKPATMPLHSTKTSISFLTLPSVVPMDGLRTDKQASHGSINRPLPRKTSGIPETNGYQHGKTTVK